LLGVRALLLGVGALFLAVSALTKRLELKRHLLHGVSEDGELAGDARDVLFGAHFCGFYARQERRRYFPCVQDLRDVVALVTGSSRGGGKGIALVLGERGATVYVTGPRARREYGFTDVDGTQMSPFWEEYLEGTPAPG
jgi:hypothetical protein